MYFQFRRILPQKNHCCLLYYPGYHPKMSVVISRSPQPHCSWIPICSKEDISLLTKIKLIKIIKRVSDDEEDSISTESSYHSSRF